MKPLPILAFAVAAAIGWLIAGSPAPPAKQITGETTAPNRSDRTERPTRKTRGPDGISGQRLAAIRASRDPSARMRATVDLASTLSPADFAEWMDGGWFNVRGGAELTLFTKIIEERWINEDPEGFVAWALKNRSGRAASVLASWAKTDPRRVLDFYKNHPDDAAEMRSLEEVAKADPAMALQRFQELAASGSNSNSEYYARNMFSVLAEKSPATLEAALETMPAKMRLQAETALIAQRMKSSFDDEFAKLQDRPDGFKLMVGILNGNGDGKEFDAYRKTLFANLATLPSSWLSSIASNPYGFISGDIAEQWATADLEASGFTTEQAKRIQSEALGRLYNKPEIALKLLGSMNVDDNIRENLLGNIFRNIRDEPDRVEKLIAMLESDKDREIASGFAAKPGEGGNPKLDNPTDWLTGIAALGSDSNSSAYTFTSALRNWDKDKLDTLSNQFNVLPAETKRDVANSLLKSSYSSRTPLEADAIRFLIENPDPTPPDNENSRSSRETPEAKNIQLASRYVGKLARTDPTAASDWVRTLPEGQPKLWAQKNLHALWSQYDPAAADEWFGTLPATTRESVKNLKTR